MHNFLAQLPKAELHNHLDGSLRIETILDLARKDSVKLPTFEYNDLKGLLINDENCQSLKEYFIPFDISLSVLQTEEALERTTFELLEDVHKENVKYLEIRFSPILHIKEGLSLDKIVEAVLRGKKQAEYNLGIKSGIIICGLRHNTPGQNLELANLAVRYMNKGVIAYDLAGEEFGRPALDHVKAFEYAFQHNLARTAHAGEADGAHSIYDAIYGLKANRIGHGTHLFQDADLLKYIRDEQIPLEVCLSSNLQTKAVDSLDKHPIQDYFKQGLVITLNTDSYLISGTTLTKEFELAVKHYKFDKKEIAQLTLNSFQSAFLPFDEKQDLISNAQNELKILLANHI
ncbi:MAG: adenosine deaminase [Bacteroidales bacterium]|jgi:adenosine deaminase|nr:adenosine deaminase [Bacteroidales bacterium]